MHHRSRHRGLAARLRGDELIPAAAPDQHSPYVIGAMSGTSLDGVDVALVQFPSAAAPLLVQAHHQPYAPTLRQALLAVCQGQAVTLAAAGALDIQVARAYAQAVHTLLQQAGVAASQVQVLGAHGQTVHHQPTAMAGGEFSPRRAALFWGAKTGVLSLFGLGFFGISVRIGGLGFSD